MAAAEAQIAVVEIEIADHHAVGEHGEIGARLDAAAHHGGAALRGDARREPVRDLARLCAEAAEPATDRIDQEALGLAHDVRRDVLVAQARRVAGERLGDGRPAGATRCAGAAPVEAADGDGDDDAGFSCACARLGKAPAPAMTPVVAICLRKRRRASRGGSSGCKLSLWSKDSSQVF